MGILLFNWCGFRLLVSFMEQRGNSQLVGRLDRQQYDDAQLISIKVSAKHLSYYNSSASFERVDGQIETGGVRYNYVRRRIYNDSVEMLCIPNLAAMHAKAIKNDLGKKQGSQSVSYKLFSPDCLVGAEDCETGGYYCIARISHPFLRVSFNTIDLSPGERPPAGLCALSV